jgi:hypothetical protein
MVLPTTSCRCTVDAATIAVAAIVGAIAALPLCAQEAALNLYGLLALLASSSTSQAPTSGPEQAGPTSEETVPEGFGIHGQFTNVTQYHPPFTSPFYGPNSLIPGHRGNETTDLTLFAAVRLWDGLEAYVNPEPDQGFGLSNTLGVAGFPSGEAYKVGAAGPHPDFRTPSSATLSDWADGKKKSSPA